jgi:nitrous oxidase accessory protein NosD
VGFFLNDFEQVRDCSLIQDDPDVDGERSSHGMYIHSGARSVIVSNCLIENVRKYAIQLYGQELDSTLDGVKLLGNTIRNCHDGVIVTAFSEGPLFRNISIEDNQIEDIEGIAIRVRKGDQVSIRRNTINRCADGVVLADWQPGLQGYFLKGVNVENNTISHCHGAIWVIANNGEPVHEAVINNNTITDCGLTLSVQGVSSFSFTIK